MRDFFAFLGFAWTAIIVAAGVALGIHAALDRFTRRRADAQAIEQLLADVEHAR